MGAKAQLQVIPEFSSLLQEYSLEALNAETGAVIGLWPSGRIALLNAGWFDFALENDSPQVLERWQLGDSLLLAISGPLREYYASAFERVLREATPWEQTYSCHGPRVERQFRLRVQPLEQKGLLLTHSLLVSDVIPDMTGDAFVSKRYVDANGFVHQCSNCRRIRRISGAPSWDWIAEFVGHPPGNASHGLCSVCYGQYCSTIVADPSAGLGTPSA